MKLSPEERESLQQNYALAVTRLYAETDAILERFDRYLNPKKYTLLKLEEYEADLATTEESYKRWIYLFRDMEHDPKEMTRAFFYAYKETIATEIEYLEKQIRRIRFKQSKTPKGEIGAKEILQAKEVPIPELLPIGRNSKTKCLWHSEKTPSLHYYKDTNRLWCFSCNKGFDSVDVVMKSDSLTFIEAVRFLIKR